MEYTDELTCSISGKRAVADLPCTAETKLLTTLSASYDEIFEQTEKLAADIVVAEGITNELQLATYYHDTILPQMESIRALADKAEELLPDDLLPYPSYEQLLFSI